MVFPAEMKDWIVGPSAFFSIVDPLAKEPTRESMENCSNSDQTLWLIRTACGRDRKCFENGLKVFCNVVKIF
jgi:hypothetical protein